MSQRRNRCSHGGLSLIHILIDSKDLEEQRQAARTLMEVFDTYCPGTYLYQAEDLYGIRDGLEWDMTYCENQIMPFRAGDLKGTE